MTLLLGCDAAPAPEPEPAPRASTEAPLDFCRELCARTAACSLELAKEQARPADTSALSALERELPQQQAACKQTCEAEEKTDRIAFQHERARVCLGKTDCAELDRCMSAL